MTETITKNAICRHCSADIREGSLFCYNCGKPVADRPAVNGRSPESEIAELELAAEAAEKPQPVAAPGKKLRSATDFERRKRAFNRQPIEVTWTPRTDDVNSFVVAGLILIILTAVLIIAALYYR